MRASTLPSFVYRLVFGLSLLVVAPPAPTAARGADAPLASVCESVSGTGTLSGIVTLPGGAPMQNAGVSLFTAAGQLLRSGSTNAAGAYQFTGLPAGQYLLRVTPYYTSPYAPEWYNSQVNPANATPIAVDNGFNAIANVELALGTQISGQIVGSDGAPLAYAGAAVFDRFGNMVASGGTDAAGNYITAPGLVSGEYRVRFSVNTSVPYFSEYYPDQPSLDLAQPITVTAPNPITGFNATLQRGGQITGRATAAGTGDPVYATVYFERNGTYAYTNTDANGNYAYGPLTSGVYTVKFFPTYPSSTPLYGSTHLVSVSAPNTVPNVDGVFMPAGQITGHVTNSSGGPAAGGYAYANRADDYRYSRNAVVDASGAYTLTGLAPGDYQVYFSLDGHARELYDNKLPHEAPDLVTVTPPETVAGIDAALSAGGSLSGTVTAADTGLPLKDVSVRVELAGNRNVNYYVETDANGHYVAHGLPGGQYRVRFQPASIGMACAYQSEWYSDKPSRSTADAVTVTDGAVTPDVNAALARGSLFQGRVFDAADGTPLPDVSVSVFDASGREVAQGYTNVLGYYSTGTPVPSGAYRVLFTSYDGYVSEYHDDALTLAAAQPVNVTAPTDVTGLNAGLSLGGFIAGRVTAADGGQGLNGVLVTVYDLAGNPLAYDYTEADGSYKTYNGLPTGDYRVGFAYPAASGSGLAAPSVAELTAARYGITPPGARDPEAPPDSAVLPSDGSGSPAEAGLPEVLAPFAPEPSLAGGVFVENPGYLPLFYNGQFTFAEADLVPVTALQTTTGVDVALPRGVFLPIIQR